MARYTNWSLRAYVDHQDYIQELRVTDETRKEIVVDIQHDIADWGANIGQTSKQIERKVDQLFSAFPGEWSIYILVGSLAIRQAIKDDVTLPWLNKPTTPSGTRTVRTMILRRLR